MVSKKLLSEVLNDKVEEIYGLGGYHSNEVQYVSKYVDNTCVINIYELAHKCKEWAISKGYITDSIRNLKEYVVCLSGDRKESSDDFRAKTEPEAIFKATQWILDNKDKQ